MAWPLLVYMLCLGPVVTRGAQETGKQREYAIKAVFIYNFIKFVDGFRFEDQQSKAPIVLAIVGEDPFGSGFDPLLEKPIGERYLKIKRLAIHPDPNNPQSIDANDLKGLRACNIVFVSSSERPRLAGILEAVRTEPILTIGDHAGFLEAGVIINLGVEGNKVFFEINLDAAARANINLRSQLLRLAKRLVKEDKTGRG
ncbi:MAG: YfiR family protein [Sedimentisphaerales bacterium]|nr:YfiR family protein [Sedimentisphaerales bacterium]